MTTKKTKKTPQEAMAFKLCRELKKQSPSDFSIVSFILVGADVATLARDTPAALYEQSTLLHTLACMNRNYPYIAEVGRAVGILLETNPETGKPYFDPNALEMAFGRTPLQHAAKYSTPDIVLRLLDAGGDPYFKNEEFHPQFPAQTAFDIARTKNRMDIVEAMDAWVAKKAISQAIKSAAAAAP